MNGDRPVEDAHYTETGFPYAATGNYIDFYGGAAQGPLNYAHAGAGTMHPQVFPLSLCFFFLFFLAWFIPPLVSPSEDEISFLSQSVVRWAYHYCVCTYVTETHTLH